MFSPEASSWPGAGVWGTGGVDTEASGKEAAAGEAGQAAGTAGIAGMGSTGASRPATPQASKEGEGVRGEGEGVAAWVPGIASVGASSAAVGTAAWGLDQVDQSGVGASSVEVTACVAEHRGHGGWVATAPGAEAAEQLLSAESGTSDQPRSGGGGGGSSGADGGNAAAAAGAGRLFSARGRRRMGDR